EKLPAGWAITAEGNPVTNPSEFYGPPMGAILSAGHKGYGLALVVDILAGAVTGGGCARPVDHVHTPVNGFVVMAINVALFTESSDFTKAVDGLLRHVKSSPALVPGKGVLIPNKLEKNGGRRGLVEELEWAKETWGRFWKPPGVLEVKKEF